MPRKISSPAPSTSIDAARPRPAPIRARRWPRATYTPRASSSSARIGSTILRSLISRYPDCALTRHLAENRVSVGLMAGILQTRVKPGLTRSCLTTSMNGPRPTTTWPFLTLTELPPWPDSAFTSSCWNRVGPNPGLREPRARHDLVDLAVNEPGHPAGDRRGHRLEQRADFGQSTARELGRGLIGVTGHVEPGGDLVGQGILDRRIVGQRFHGRHVAVSVADLVGRPDGQPRYRRHGAADHDEDRGSQGSPAEAPAADRAGSLSAQLVLFVLLAGPRVCGCRPRLAARVRKGLPPAGFPRQPPFAAAAVASHHCPAPRPPVSRAPLAEGS